MILRFHTSGVIKIGYSYVSETANIESKYAG